MLTDIGSQKRTDIEPKEDRRTELDLRSENTDSLILLSPVQYTALDQTLRFPYANNILMGMVSDNGAYPEAPVDEESLPKAFHSRLR